ncbi:DegT/DnrJ/EryC1/StrS family aminotransferase [Dyella subtropica]|uniref:DegT/DnrJ/EryC1/StrS family aminotransferase n=1 Tax=Dyella subtropica TaxID=2992127 RepID=UPI00224E98E5|nr:DegT/DnrJ/EryC1/StrS family aminotransferase [Dyella subtropica]
MNINVTKPFLPPLAEYHTYLQGVWEREWLTNNGPLVNELEVALKERLDLDHLLFVSNGTIAIQLALKALNITGEVITTPFSYVATSSAVCWEGCVPVMADISPLDFNIDPEKIEAKITPHTSAILATHVYGNPCDVDAIEAIAAKHGLRVIYDAAHAFGTRYKNRSLFSYGDVATSSFHATKLFHTIEGGAVIARDPAVLKRMAEMRNFGHISPTAFQEVGINGKNSEVHAAMGLCNLKYLDDILRVRKSLSERYDRNLAGLPIQRPVSRQGTDFNHAYYAVAVEDEALLLKIIDGLQLHNIFPRRYFFPSLSTLPYVSTESCPVAEDLSRRVMCLPLYHTLSEEEVDMICRLIKRYIRY